MHASVQGAQSEPVPAPRSMQAAPSPSHCSSASTVPSPQKLVGPPELDEVALVDDMPLPESSLLLLLTFGDVLALLDASSDDEPEAESTRHGVEGESDTQPSLSATHTLQYTVAPPRSAHVASPS